MTYRLAIERHDIGRIEKLNNLKNADTFWDDVRKLTRRVYSDHSIRHWEWLSELRYTELSEEYAKEYEKVMGVNPARLTK